MNNSLKGKQVYLRAIEPNDLETLYVWENNMEIWELSNTIVPFSKNVLKQYIDTAHLDIYTTKQLRLIIGHNEHKTIGCIDLFEFDPINFRAGIGILIAEKEERNKGYATETLELLIKYCKNQLNLHQIYCTIAVDNKISIQLFEKLGFILTGNKKEWSRTIKGWKDELFYQLIL